MIKKFDLINFGSILKVCERVDEVDCANSEAFYNLNLDLYGQHGLILYYKSSE